MNSTKVDIPQDLKTDLPPSKFGKILGATPVVMAVVATMLAGLSSSEMTRAQYDRSLGAQQQSKAGDQWSFFQAKRLRGAIQHNTADLLQTVTAIHPFDPDALRQLTSQSSQVTSEETDPLRKQLTSLLDSPAGQQALSLLQSGQSPKIGAAQPLDPSIESAMKAVETSTPDAEMEVLVNQVDEKTLNAALHSARDEAQAFDTATKSVNQAIDQLDTLLGGLSVLVHKSSSLSAEAKASDPLVSAVRDFTAARLRYASQRYEIEARLNQTIANLFEVQVRKSNIAAEHHHRRSQRFFYGMLGAQLGVIISTLAMAAKNRNLLWSIAAAAGLVAVAFALYVFLYV
jgi:hypothetical protein